MTDTAIRPIDRSEPDAPPSGNAWTQTRALLFDAYLDLQSRKLFWFTLFLSFLVAGVFAFVGINSSGLSIFGRQLNDVPFNSNLIAPADFYKYLFTTMAIPIWLGFLSAILGLIAVGGIFPDAISSGSIDLYLCAPIGRLRLFLTKYAFGLLFTALQVSIFCVVSFLVIGFRGGAWEFGIFLAVPLVTLFFSYLYCICVLVGIVTRSTLTAILITALFWGAIFVIHSADTLITGFAARAEDRVDRQQRVVAVNDAIIAQNAALPPERRGNMSAFEFQRDAQKAMLLNLEQTSRNWQWWKHLTLAIKTPLPKTNETVSLMSRWLVRPGTLDAVEQRGIEMQQERRERDRLRREARARGETTAGPASAPTFRLPFSPTSAPATAPAMAMSERPDRPAQLNSDQMDQIIADEFGARDLPWIVGTSLGFEAFILALAAWVFCRRDY